MKHLPSGRPLRLALAAPPSGDFEVPKTGAVSELLKDRFARRVQ